MTMRISHQEFTLFRNYIKEECGIEIPIHKSYFLENRLSKLLVQYNIRNYIELYYMLRGLQKNRDLVNRVIDAITINETQWFRDRSPWSVLDDVLLPAYFTEISEKKRSKVRIWSAACSTGQEPYSIAMAIDNFLMKHYITDVNLSDFEILASDISAEALAYAKTGRYDHVSVERGLSNTYRAQYLNQEGQYWIINPKIKNAVHFEQFNLIDSFLLLGKFDIIFCRNVAIYFHDDFKRELFRKLANALTPDGVLFLGNSELFPGCQACFRQEKYQDATYYRNNMIHF